MKDILEKLVSIPTVTGESVPIGVAINYIEDYLLERGMKVERLVSDGHASLVATASGTKTPKVMLAAHVDVSPGSDEQFFLRETAGRLYGRGVVDMKFAIASYLQIVDDLRNQLNKYDFGIMITSDEEEGGLNGTAHLVNKGYLPKVCVLPDGGDNWQIQTFAKGFFYLEITVHGKAAHGSRPWLGDNAIVTLTHVITDIAALFPDMSADTNTYNIGLVRGGDS